MQILLNGQPAEISARTLADALAELGYGQSRVATALNEDFVPATLRDQTCLRDGDRLEIIAPMQGG